VNAQAALGHVLQFTVSGDANVPSGSKHQLSSTWISTCLVCGICKHRAALSITDVLSQVTSFTLQTN